MALDTAALFIVTLSIKGLLTHAADTCPGKMDSKPLNAGNYLVSQCLPLLGSQLSVTL